MSALDRFYCKSMLALGYACYGHFDFYKLFFFLQFDNSLLADHLFELAVGDECLTRNRPFIYDIVKRYVYQCS